MQARVKPSRMGNILSHTRSSSCKLSLKARIARVSPAIEHDRPFYRDIAAIDALIAQGQLRFGRLDQFYVE